MRYLKWFYPGMNVKRWIGLVMLGVVFIALGLAFVLKEVYETITFPEWVWYATFQFWSRWLRAGIMTVTGSVLIFIAVSRLNQSLLSALLPDIHDDMLVDMVYQRRMLKRRPRIVVIGGGTGLSTLLRGLKYYTANITAIVNMVDDGGSSGRLRREMGILPPGDLRQCIVALADAEPLMTRLFEHRFPSGNSLEGHNFGNLFITALRDITGNFEHAIHESSRVLVVRGQILPSTLTDVTISAEYEDATHMHGESQIAKQHKRIKRVYLTPENPVAYLPALNAIREADMIVVGPGSLYTSLLPNLLVPDIAHAIKTSTAMKVLITNVSTEPGETDGFSVADFVQVISDHVGANLFEYILANGEFRAMESRKSSPVAVDQALVALQQQCIKVMVADIVDRDNPLRHDSAKVTAALMTLFNNARKSRIRDFFELLQSHSVSTPAVPVKGEYK